MKFELIDKQILARGFFTYYEYTVKHELFAGGWSPLLKREMFVKGDAVALLLYDPQLDNVVMIEQFRIGAINSDGQARQSAWIIELVAGIIEPGEQELEVARREALEEANISFSDIEFVSKYYMNPSSMPEMMSLYCARVDSRDQGGIFGLAHEGEDIRVQVIPVQEAYAMIDAGAINSATPILALHWLRLNAERLKQKWC